MIKNMSNMFTCYLVWHTLNLLPLPGLLTHEVVTCTDCTNWSAQRGITSVNHVRAKEADLFFSMFWDYLNVFSEKKNNLIFSLLQPHDL